MAGEEGLELPIFELPVVILPGELMPLHIFEERYKRMIADCMESSEPFGMVFRDDEGGARRIGCTARVTQVVETFDDGRMNIVVTGEAPFKVLDRYEDEEYPSGEVEPIDAVGEEPARRPRGRRDRPRRLRRAGRARLGRAAGGGELADDGAYAIAARVELPSETKQKLLELRSESERMRVLGDALRALVEAVDRSEEIAERARMNGKVIVG